MTTSSGWRLTEEVARHLNTWQDELDTRSRWRDLWWRTRRKQSFPFFLRMLIPGKQLWAIHLRYIVIVIWEYHHRLWVVLTSYDVLFPHFKVKLFSELTGSSCSETHSVLTSTLEVIILYYGVNILWMYQQSSLHYHHHMFTEVLRSK